MKISRHFPVLILLIAFSLLFVGAGYAENNAPKEFCVASNYKFTPAELKSLELIKRAKEFEKGLGYKETENFKSFAGNVKHVAIMYHLKTEMPFSYEDYHFFSIQKRESKGSASEMAWLASYLEITKDKYDIDIYYLEAVAGGTPISPAMLSANPSRLAYLVFHEDWHDNVNLPTHFEEASGNLIGYGAAAMFLGSNIHKELEAYSRFAEAINKVHDEISKLVVKLKNKEISRKKYLLERRRRIARMYPGLDLAEVAFHHTYTYYWPLAYRLYLALDCDLPRFIQVLKEVSQHAEMREPPLSELSRKDYFVKSREAEKRIEVYLEKVIQKELADKEERFLINEIIRKSFPEMPERIFCPFLLSTPLIF